VSADWLMYVVECADGSYYTGITTDMTRRLNEHNRTKRGAKYTRSRRPVSLIYFESHENRSEASRAEAAFKKLTRKKKEVYIDWN
jgi:putative endonuclease